MSAFNGRIKARERFGVPAALVEYVGGGLFLILINVTMIENRFLSVVLFAVSIILIAKGSHDTYHHDNLLWLPAKRASKRELKGRAHHVRAKF